ncbi:2769_t:CDS:2, partial [Paraglomus occultum]
IPIRLDVMLVDDRMQEEKKIQTIDDLLPPNEKVDKAKNMLKLYEEERKIQETNSVTVKAEHTLINETNIITNLIFSDDDDTDRLFLSSMLSHDNNSSYWKVEVENRVQELDTKLKKIERKLDDMRLRDQRLLSEAEKMSAQIDEILAASHVDRDNQDHLYTLKVLEDEIQLLNSKSILWDIFYIMLSYVLA